MSQKKAKQIRKTIRKEEFRIKTEGLNEFIKYCHSQKFRKRFLIAWKILFKMVKIGP